MPWIRVGDDAATYPTLMSTMGVAGADTRTVNEAFGFLMRLAILSGSHLTDYVLDVGTCAMLGGERTPELLDMCVAAGLMKPTTTQKGIKAYQIIQDDDFIHLKLKKEVEWERQRLRDNRDVSITSHVRLRDGDQCRYCRIVVQWRGKSSHRTGTYDHLHPGEAATVDTMVVACWRCNTSRQDDPQWSDDHPLLPPPGKPLYSKWTAKFLEDAGYPVAINVGPDQETKTTASAGSAALQAPGSPDQAASAGPSAADPGSAPEPGGDAAGAALEVDPGSPDQAASAGSPNAHPGTDPSIVSPSTTASAGSAALQAPGSPDQAASAGPSAADPGSAPEPGGDASAGHATTSDTPTTGALAGGGVHPGVAPGPGSECPRKVDEKSLRCSIESTSAGSGRDGTVRVGKEREGPGRDGGRAVSPGRGRGGKGRRRR